MYQPPVRGLFLLGALGEHLAGARNAPALPGFLPSWRGPCPFDREVKHQSLYAGQDLAMNDDKYRVLMSCPRLPSTGYFPEFRGRGDVVGDSLLGE
jgi:hypothetical protein